MCSRLTLFRLASGHETRHFRTTRPAFLKRKNRIAGLPFPSSGKNPTRPFPAGRHATSRKSLPARSPHMKAGKSLFSLPPRFQDQSPSLPAGKRAAASPVLSLSEFAGSSAIYAVPLSPGNTAYPVHSLPERQSRKDRTSVLKAGKRLSGNGKACANNAKSRPTMRNGNKRFRRFHNRPRQEENRL